MAKLPVVSGKQVKVTLIKSAYGRIKSHRETVRGLGLRRIRDSRVLVVTPAVLGMIHAAGHLLKVEQA